MPDSVFSSTMTLDGSQYLATNAKLLAATSKVDAALAHMHARIAQLVSGLMPAQTGLSATARALSGLGEDRTTTGMRQIATGLAAITQRAADAGQALQGVRAGAEATQGALDENGGTERSEAEQAAPKESPAAAPGGEGVGSLIAQRQQVGGLRAIAMEEARVEEATAKMGAELHAEAAGHEQAAGATNQHRNALGQLAAGASEAAAAATGETAAVNRSTAAKERGAVASRHLAAEEREAAFGFRGLGESASKAGELIRDAFLATPEIAALVAVFSSVENAIEKIRESFKYGDELNALSRQTGESAESIAALRRTFEYFDVDANAVGTTLFMLQRALGGTSDSGESTAGAFGRIGLSIAQLKQMNAAEQFSAIQQGLAKLPTQADRADTAMKIFGRSALEVQSILNADPADFTASMAAAQDYAGVMGRNADTFEELERKFFIFRETGDTFFARIAAAIAPAIGKMMDLFNTDRVVAWKDSLIMGLTVLSNAFAKGKVFELAGLELKLGFIDAFNQAGRNTQALNAALLAMARSFMALWKSEFQALANPALWKGMGELFLGGFLSIQGRLAQLFVDLAVTFGSLLQKVLNDVVNTFANNRIVRTAIEVLSPGGAALLSLLKPDDRSFQQIQSDNTQRFAGVSGVFAGATAKGDAMGVSGAAKIEGALAPVVSRALDGVSDVIQAFQSTYRNAPNLVDPTATVNKLAGLLRDLATTPNSAAPNRGVAGASQAEGFNFKLPEGDRLSKIGLFVGSSTAAPGLSELRRTAAATENTAKGVQRMITVWGKTGVATLPVYG